jgi:hypothetical protein
MVDKIKIMVYNKNMNLKEKLYEKIIRDSTIPNINGYVNMYNDNLINGIENKYFENDLKNGSGNELNEKFRALWSSSALVVNNFVPFVKNITKITFNNNIFEKAGFERKFSTGLGGTPPNIDFFMEKADLLIGFESKFSETLVETKSEFKERYFSIKYLNSKFIELIKKYNNKNNFLHISQLLKHSIGLINYKMQTGKNVILYYIYWTPLNWNDFDEYNKHENELKIFSKEINDTNQIEFKSIKYIDLWKMYEKDNILKKHISKLRNRYEIKI